MRKILFCFVILVLFCGGCDIVGWIINPGPYDRKVPAEFKIKDRAKEKILVFVDQASGDVGMLMRANIRDSISTLLVSRAKVSKKYLVVRNESDLISQPGMSYLNYDPIKIANDAGAGLILYTRVLDHKLSQSGPRNYYIGYLNTASVIIDTKKQEVVWPTDGKPRVVRMELLTETKGKEAAVENLMTSTAHGIVRHLYNIRRVHFRTSLEKNEMLNY